MVVCKGKTKAESGGESSATHMGEKEEADASTIRMDGWTLCNGRERAIDHWALKSLVK